MPTPLFGLNAISPTNYVVSSNGTTTLYLPATQPLALGTITDFQLYNSGGGTAGTVYVSAYVATTWGGSYGVADPNAGGGTCVATGSTTFTTAAGYVTVPVTNTYTTVSAASSYYMLAINTSAGASIQLGGNVTSSFGCVYSGVISPPTSLPAANNHTAINQVYAFAEGNLPIVTPLFGQAVF